jgi:hypothetical protein
VPVPESWSVSRFSPQRRCASAQRRVISTSIEPPGGRTRSQHRGVTVWRFISGPARTAPR